jgi:hypothetical protein
MKRSLIQLWLSGFPQNPVDRVGNAGFGDKAAPAAIAALLE